MNQLTLLGAVTGPVTYHCTDRGQDLVRFTIQTRSSTRNEGYGPVTHDHHCHAWGGAALDLHANLCSGDRLMIRGELTYRIYRGRAGTTRRIADIYVTSYTYLGRGTAAVMARVGHAVNE